MRLYKVCGLNVLLLLRLKEIGKLRFVNIGSAQSFDLVGKCDAIDPKLYTYVPRYSKYYKHLNPKYENMKKKLKSKIADKFSTTLATFVWYPV